MIAKIKRIRKPYETLFFSAFFAILLFVMIGFLFYSNLKINQKRLELKNQIRVLKEELQILEQKRNELQSQVSQSSQEEYLEKEARERFNLKKPGEEVVTILPEEREEPSKEKEGVLWNLFRWLIPRD